MKVWKNRSMVTLVALCLALAAVLGACSNSNNGNSTNENAGSNANAETPSASESEPKEETAPPEPPVELTWHYIVFNMPTDLEAVEEAINAYLVPKINVKLNLEPIIESGYKDKINTMLAANEPFDLLWTSNWGGGDYDNKVAKGAFLELDDMLEQRPALKEAIPQVAWEDTRVSGKIYAVPNMQIAAKADGYVIQKRFLDKYNFDVNSIRSPYDIEPLLQMIKENEPDIIPIAKTDNIFDFGRAFGYTPFSYKIDDPERKIIETIDKPEYRQFLDVMRSWYTNGYIYKDAATMKDDQFVALLQQGKVAVEWNTTMKPGGEVEDQKRFGGNEVVYVRLSEPEFTGVRPTMTAVSRTSKNPDKALELIELTATDPTLFNLLAFGIEDKHYTKVGDNMVRINQDGGYKDDLGWVFGNVLIGYLKEGQAPDTWEKTMELNDSAKRPETTGFNHDTEPFKTEAANTDAVSQQYGKALQSGAVDPAEVFPKYHAAFKKAGYEKILEIKQQQLDEWFASQGK
jgi:putative aldouronate transport system substrate-binding protein